MSTSVSHTAPAAHAIDEVPGTDRLLGRTRDELADAMTFLAWWAPGTYTAVLDYLDHCDGELVPVSKPAFM